MYIYYSFILLLLSCKQGATINQSSQTQAPPATQNTSISNDKILFLQFGMLNDSIKQKDSIYFKGFKVRPGKIKEKETSIIENKIPGMLLCTFRDNNQKTLFVKMIDNPLHLNVETTDEKNNLIRKEINSAKAELTLRCKFNNSISSLEFHTINKEGVIKPLSIIYININEP